MSSGRTSSLWSAAHTASQAIEINFPFIRAAWITHNSCARAVCCRLPPPCESPVGDALFFLPAPLIRRDADGTLIFEGDTVDVTLGDDPTQGVFEGAVQVCAVCADNNQPHQELCRRITKSYWFFDDPTSRTLCLRRWIVLWVSRPSSIPHFACWFVAPPPTPT